jgi:para-aminobenzoate synthetase component 1
MRIDVTNLQALMNDYGRSRKPFVFAVDYEMRNCLLFDDPLHCGEIRWSTEMASNSGGTVEESGESDNNGSIGQSAATPRLIIKNALPFDEYARKFAVIRNGLLHGDSFLANLTVGVEVECNLSFEEIYDLCEAKYKLLIPGEFVCFSPERFIRITSDKVYAYPMKGTIDASIPEAETVLINDYKERCEHNTIVDLLRNDLSMVAEKVRVSRFRYVDRIKTQSGEILQTSSEIVGDLPADWHSSVGDLVFRLLPAGSICGAPKPATVRLIAAAEQSDRGWYTGVWGYYDGVNLDTAVMIRCLANEEGKTVFHSGGGITVNSCAEDEYNEVLQKIYLPIK